MVAILGRCGVGEGVGMEEIKVCDVLGLVHTRNVMM